MRTRHEVMQAIWKERERQEEKEGWTPEHDDEEHRNGELGLAAACYAAPERLYVERRLRRGVDTTYYEHALPWVFPDKIDEHPRLRQLEIAAALIVAEIERLERATP
jgi:hypothetical protein